MLALFLDESGVFEKKEESVLLNAGLVYKGPELDRDIQGLHNFFNKLCNQYGLVFPDGLHSSDIRKHKSAVQEKFFNFLAQQKKWAIIGIVGGDYEQDRRSNVVRDEIASNLYRNMLVRLLDNFLHYSSLPEKEWMTQLNIASRVAVISSEEGERHQQYKKLGYGSKKNPDGSVRYFLIDERVIGAVLGQLYKERVNPPSLDFQLRVESIYREKNVGLMAADLVCNYLYGQINRGAGDLGLKNIMTNLRTFNLNSYLWAYDPVDDRWRDLNNFYREGNIFEFLALRNKILTENSGIARYYAGRWMPSPPRITIPRLEKAIAVLSERRKNPNVSHYQEMQIAEELTRLAAQDQDKLSTENIYHLYDLMLQLNNHMGNPEIALEHGKKAIRELERQPRTPDNYRFRLETRLRMSSIETNRFHFKGAIKILQEELAPRLESRLSQGEDDFGPLIDPALGKCYGALGQNYAFLGKNEDALELFISSLKHFASDYGNIEITITHILHLALAMESMELFEHYAPDFFHDPVVNSGIPRHEGGPRISSMADSRGKDGLSLLGHRWNDALESKNPFKLLVFLKAANLMGLWKKAAILESILGADYLTYFGSEDSHPWELNYRHMAEIAFKAGHQRLGQNFIKKSIAVGFPEPSLTFRVMHLGTRAMGDSYLYKEKELAARYREKIEELKQICLGAPDAAKYIYNQENPDSWFYDCVIDVDSDFSPHEIVQKFLKRFTYAYR